MEEEERQIVFADGHRETFRNVTRVDAKGGDWLRFQCDEGYILVNPDNVLYILVKGKRVR